MPFIHVRYSGADLSDNQTATLRTRILHEMETTMHKERRLTSVLIEKVAGDWTIGGAAVQPAAHVEAIVTDGTNSEAEKSAFIAAIFEELRSVFGNELHDATYVVVRDIDATAWGYGGRTQMARRIERETASGAI